MTYRLILLAALSIGLISCGGQQVKTDSDTRQSKNQNKKADERGFDPCLLNANLPVCNDK